MMTTETTAPKAQNHLLPLVTAAQSRAKADRLFESDCNVALDLYAQAVAFCSANDLALSGIRVVIAGGRKANSYKYPGECTELTFDGKAWSASRTRAAKCAGGSGSYGSSYVWLPFDAVLPDRAHALKGRKYGEGYKIPVAKFGE